MNHQIKVLARGDTISSVTNEYALDHAVFSVTSSHEGQQKSVQGVYRVPPLTVMEHPPNFENLQFPGANYIWITTTQTMWLWCPKHQQWIKCTDCPRAQPAANINQDQLVALIEASPEYQQLIQENAEKLDIQP